MRSNAPARQKHEKNLIISPNWFLDLRVYDAFLSGLSFGAHATADVLFCVLYTHLPEALSEALWCGTLFFLFLPWFLTEARVRMLHLALIAAAMAAAAEAYTTGYQVHLALTETPGMMRVSWRTAHPVEQAVRPPYPNHLSNLARIDLEGASHHGGGGGLLHCVA